MFHRGTQKGGRQSKYTVQVMERDNRKLFALLESKTYCGSRGITLRRVAKTVAALPPTMITRKKDTGNFKVDEPFQAINIFNIT